MQMAAEVARDVGCLYVISINAEMARLIRVICAHQPLGGQSGFPSISPTVGSLDHPWT